MQNHSKHFFKDVSDISSMLNHDLINNFAKNLRKLRNDKGRLFFLGVGGSAANGSHAVNDFRKICNIESYCITDNVSELTARTNDEGWDTTFSNWLKISNLSKKDAIFVFSVGGGNISKKVSVNIVNAIKFADKKKCKIFGIIGNKNGYITKKSKNVIIVPCKNNKYKTPIVESFHALIWHCLVSHPQLQINKTKW